MAVFHEFVAVQGAKHADRPAVVGEGVAWSYGELLHRAGRIAASLQRRGIAPGNLVGLCIDRSPEAVAAVLGVLRAGGAFLPLDPVYPAERLRLMLDEAQPSVVLADALSAASLPPHRGRTLEIAEALASDDADPAPPPVEPEQLAYVIYTSGSTGRPKGVMVPHRGIVNLALEQIRLFGVEPDSRVLQFASLNFDAAVAEIAVALCAGASLHVAPRGRLLPVEPLALLLRQRRITHVTLPPSLLALLPDDVLPPGMTLILAGEPCGAALVARWVSGHRLFNAYGPTEATVCATAGRCVADGQAPSIGHPIGGVDLLILDGAMRPVPVGATGEIHLGGIGLALGYLGQPELSAERFVERAGRRLYRTGDLGRWRPDGAVDFLGRADRQVKLHGHRIELEEIEAVLTAHPQVEAAAVTVQGSGADVRLAAYVVGPSGRSLETAVLRRHLGLHLPAWMIPTAVVALDAFPLMPNGKIDRTSLPAPVGHARNEATPLLAPRDALELVLATAWRDVLDVHQVGVRDDFFALGGDSLKAVRLATRLERDIGQRLPISAFVPGVTIERLAIGLRAAGSPADWSPLVALSPAGDEPPLFLVHPAGGTVLAYAELARSLGGRVPVYGIQAFGMDPGQTPLARVEEMAEAYVVVLRKTLRPRSWRIAGWSFGAVVAFEMVRRLRAMGEPAMDPIAIDAPARHRPPQGSEIDIVQRVIRMYGDMLALEPATVPGGGEADRLDRMVAAAVTAGIFPADFGSDQARRLAGVIAGCFHAGEAYRPLKASGGVTLIRAADNPMPADDPALGWQDLVEGPVDLRLVPGTHTTMLREPLVADLAEAIGDRLSSDLGSAPGFDVSCRYRLPVDNDLG